MVRVALGRIVACFLPVLAAASGESLVDNGTSGAFFNETALPGGGRVVVWRVPLPSGWLKPEDYINACAQLGLRPVCDGDRSCQWADERCITLEVEEKYCGKPLQGLKKQLAGHPELKQLLSGNTCNYDVDTAGGWSSGSCLNVDGLTYTPADWLWLFKRYTLCTGPVGPATSDVRITGTEAAPQPGGPVGLHASTKEGLEEERRQTKNTQLRRQKSVLRSNLTMISSEEAHLEDAVYLLSLATFAFAGVSLGLLIVLLAPSASTWFASALGREEPPRQAQLRMPLLQAKAEADTDEAQLRMPLLPAKAVADADEAPVLAMPPGGSSLVGAAPWPQRLRSGTASTAAGSTSASASAATADAAPAAFTFEPKVTVVDYVSSDMDNRHMKCVRLDVPGRHMFSGCCNVRGTVQEMDGFGLRFRLVKEADVPTADILRIVGAGDTVGIWENVVHFEDGPWWVQSPESSRGTAFDEHGIWQVHLVKRPVARTFAVCPHISLGSPHRAATVATACGVVGSSAEVSRRREAYRLTPTTSASPSPASSSASLCTEAALLGMLQPPDLSRGAACAFDGAAGTDAAACTFDGAAGTDVDDCPASSTVSDHGGDHGAEVWQAGWTPRSPESSASSRQEQDWHVLRERGAE